MNPIRLGLLACVAALLLPAAAMAACPTAPTYTGLTGKDATPATQTMQTVTAAAGQLATPMVHGNDGTAVPKPITVDANCNIVVVPADSANNQLAPGNVQTVSLSGSAASIMLAPATPTTYFFSKTGLAVPTAATDVLEIVGAGSLVTRIEYVKISCKNASAATIDVSMFRKNSVLTGGVKVALTAPPADNFLGYSAASSTVNTITTNTTGGGTITGSAGGGEIASATMFIGATTTPTAPPSVVYFGQQDALTANILLLRKNTDTFTINLNAANAANTTCDVSGAFTELSS